MNIGLVLSGGMAKGAYQIGALKALNNFIPPSEIKYISCASVGVLNGYAYAVDRLDQAEAMWKNVCSNDARYLISQILKSSMLQQNIVNLYDPEKKLDAVFYSTLLDWVNGRLVYKDISQVDHEKVPQYLKASVAMPVYNRAVQVDKQSYFDGAMVDNIPVFPLVKHDLDYVICMYFDDTCYKFETTEFDRKVIKITFPSESILRQSVSFTQGSIEKMIKTGYDTTMQLLKLVFVSGYEDLDHIYEMIALLNRNNRNPTVRITGDFLVTNLNRITKKLTIRKIL